MRHKHLPSGKTWEEAFRVPDGDTAKRTARMRGEKLWFRISSSQNHVFEIWPGGRSIAWPLEILQKRRERQGPLHADHRCKHAWETHTDSEPTAAGVHIEQWRQCLKCGQIREPVVGA